MMLAELSVSVNDLALIEQELNKHGISILDENNNVRTVEEILNDVAKDWK